MLGGSYAGETSMEKKGTVLVWRGVPTISSNPFIMPDCLMCDTPLIVNEAHQTYSDNYINMEPGVIWAVNRDCPLCGWHYYFNEDSHGWLNTSVTEVETSILRNLDVNSDELSLLELGSHLRKNFSNIHLLSPTRFEKLVESVFREQGFDTIHTGRSGDGGADIVLLKHARKERWAIVECKRYAEHNKVDVLILRALVGAAVDWRVRRAYLVTSSDFTSAVKRKVADFKERGYEVDLVAATELLQMLRVYNAALPSLDKLTDKVRREIIETNQKLLK